MIQHAAAHYGLNRSLSIIAFLLQNMSLEGPGICLQ